MVANPVPVPLVIAESASAKTAEVLDFLESLTTKEDENDDDFQELTFDN